MPADFDLEAHIGVEPWELGDGEHSTARIRFDPSVAWWPQQNMPDLVATEQPDGAVEIQMPVANLDALIAWAIGFGDRVEVLEPEAARRRMVEHLAPFQGSV